MIRSNVFPFWGGILLVGGAMMAVGAFGEETAPRKLTDRAKDDVEVPTKQMLAAATTPTSANPKVPPGLVRWHADFAAACEAAQKSKKPVLLFQMMGKLDDQFC
jgi:hypothetical protein